MLRSLRKDEQALLFQMLIVAGLSIIIFFTTINVGTFLNGTISDTLTEDYASNTLSGSLSIDHWDNETGTATHAFQMNLTTEADNLDLTTSFFYIRANATAIEYNLTVNGQQVNKTDNISEGEGWNTTFSYLISNSSINASDTTITFDWDISDYDDCDGDVVNICAFSNYSQSGDFRTVQENMTFSTLVNLSGDFDNTVDSLAIAAIVMAITLPLAAVVAIRKFF